MKANNLDENMFKEIASLYVEQEGTKLLSELKNTETIPNLNLDARLQKDLKKNTLYKRVKKITFVAAPLAACFLIFLLFAQPLTNLLGGSFSTQETADYTPISPPATPSEYNKIEIASLSQNLPEGYLLAKTDYDNGKTIYYINNDRDNEIILAVEEDSYNLDTTGFTPTTINGNDAYVLAKADYKVVLVQANGLLYTGTSSFDIQDIVDIVTAVI